MKAFATIGQTNWRDIKQIFGIKDHDRLGHIYVIGKTGTGKSTLLRTMAVSDFNRGHGCCIIDPHGDISSSLRSRIPQERLNDVICLNVMDNSFPIRFNPIAGIPEKEHSVVSSHIVSAFKKIWADFWGPRLEHLLRFAVLTLLKYPGATILDIPSLFTNTSYRTKALSHVTDTTILSFWRDEFEKHTPAMRNTMIAPVMNKVGALSASVPLRTILGHSESSFSLRDIMDNRKILICNLAKGIIGEDASALLGSLLITAVQTAALSRAAIPEQERVPFFLYIDEMQSFVTLSLADILAESRKYGIGLFLAHQYIDQLEGEIKSAIFGNVGTLISFRVGADDAIRLQREFKPIINAEDLVNLPNYHMYVKLMIDYVTSRPFSAITTVNLGGDR